MPPLWCNSANQTAQTERSKPAFLQLRFTHLWRSTTNKPSDSSLIVFKPLPSHIAVYAIDCLYSSSLSADLPYASTQTLAPYHSYLSSPEPSTSKSTCAHPCIHAATLQSPPLQITDLSTNLSLRRLSLASHTSIFSLPRMNSKWICNSTAHRQTASELEWIATDSFEQLVRTTLRNRCKCPAPKPTVRAQRTHRAQWDDLAELHIRPGERSSVRDPVVQDHRRKSRGVLPVHARTMAERNDLRDARCLCGRKLPLVMASKQYLSNLLHRGICLPFAAHSVSPAFPEFQ